MTCNFLKLNTDKNEVILLGQEHLRDHFKEPTSVSLPPAMALLMHLIYTFPGHDLIQNIIKRENAVMKVMFLFTHSNVPSDEGLEETDGRWTKFVLVKRHFEAEGVALHRMSER